jgi:5-formyltetrahydrofolate cyclo-ligase
MRRFDERDEEELRFRAKAELRGRLRAIRKAVPAEARAKRSHEICERLAALDAYRSASSVLGYVAMRSEADPKELLVRAASEGKRVALPRMEDEGVGVRWSSLEGLEESGYGFMQPPESDAIADGASIDLVLVPALAVDANGFRLGWGKGHYDHLLPTLPRARRVAIVFDFQLLAELPVTRGDIAVHTVVTDARTIEIG